MRVLLSAYACEPGRGSEPGIGWNWAWEIAKLGHEVRVLTHGRHHRAGIEQCRVASGFPRNLTIVYVDIPWFAYDSEGRPKLLRLHGYIWQWAAYRTARRLQEEIDFDLVHHITWGTLRVPTLMGELAIPLIIGPVGGGERAPYRLRAGMSVHALFLDLVRDLSNFSTRLDPLVQRGLRRAVRVYVTSDQTHDLLPKSVQGKAEQHLAIGIDRDWLDSKPRQAQGRLERAEGGVFRALFVGRLVEWKGMHLGFSAFRQLRLKHPRARLTIVGRGPAEGRWRRLAARLGIASSVDWVPWRDRAALIELYASHHVFLFPSLHDSGGFVVLEAMACGLPVICLDLGGPGLIVNEKCGVVVSTARRSRREVIDGLATALTQVCSDTELHHRLAVGARARAHDFDWSKVVTNLYSSL